MKRLAEGALLGVGFCVIVVGLVLMFKHQILQAKFQNHLLSVFNADYKWHSIGEDYAGVATAIVGALMMAFSAVVARRP